MEILSNFFLGIKVAKLVMPLFKSNFQIVLRKLPVNPLIKMTICHPKIL